MHLSIDRNKLDAADAAFTTVPTSPFWFNPVDPFALDSSGNSPGPSSFKYTLTPHSFTVAFQQKTRTEDQLQRPIPHCSKQTHQSSSLRSPLTMPGNTNSGSSSNGNGGYSVNSSGTNSQVKTQVNQYLDTERSLIAEGQPLLLPRLRLVREQFQLVPLFELGWLVSHSPTLARAGFMLTWFRQVLLFQPER